MGFDRFVCLKIDVVLNYWDEDLGVSRTGGKKKETLSKRLVMKNLIIFWNKRVLVREVSSEQSITPHWRVQCKNIRIFLGFNKPDSADKII